LRERINKTSKIEVHAKPELPLPPTPDQDPFYEFNLKEATDRLEQEFIVKALMETRGNVLRAAKLLAIQRTTLIMKMKKYGIDKWDYQGGPR